MSSPSETALVTEFEMLGVLLIGNLLSMTLWGIVSVQTYEYFLESKGTPLQRITVASLWVIDTFCAALDSYILYYYGVTNHGNPDALTSSNWSISLRPLVTGVSDFVVRALFACRIYTLSGKNKLLVIWIMGLSTAVTVVAIFITATSFRLHRHVRDMKGLLYLAFILGPICDFSVSIPLCWFHYSKSGSRKTESPVNVFMAYVVHTALLVAIDATVVMITFIAAPNTMISDAFLVLLTQLYVNSYLSSLNALEKPKKRRGTTVEFSGLELPQIKPGHSPSTLSTMDESYASPRKPALAITFRTSVERTIDDNGIQSIPQAV